MYELPSGAEIQNIVTVLKSSAAYYIPEIYLSVLFLVLILADLIFGYVADRACRQSLVYLAAARNSRPGNLLRHVCCR